MTLALFTQFLMWCTVINLVLMTLAFGIGAFAADWAYGIHSRLFPVPRETYDVLLYSYLALYKLLIFFFNVVPLVALSLIGR